MGCKKCGFTGTVMLPDGTAIKCQDCRLECDNCEKLLAEKLLAELDKNERERIELTKDKETLSTHLNSMRDEVISLKQMLEKERVVQRRIHQVFNHLSNQVVIGWENCLASFGMRDGQASDKYYKEGEQ